MSNIQRIEAVVGSSVGNVVTFTLATPTTLGELIVILFITATALAPVTASSFSDGTSNVYQKAFDVGGLNNSNNFINMAQWFAQNSAPGVHTIVLTLPSDVSGSVTSAIAVHYKGISTTTALDQVAAPTPLSAQGSPWASASVTTRNPFEVLVGWADAHDTGSSTATLSPSGSWTEVVHFNDSNGNDFALFEQIVSSIQVGVETTGTTATTTSADSFAGMATYVATGDTVTEQMQFQLH
jgi:hypothetical protein